MSLKQPESAGGSAATGSLVLFFFLPQFSIVEEEVSCVLVPHASSWFIRSLLRVCSAHPGSWCLILYGAMTHSLKRQRIGLETVVNVLSDTKAKVKDPIHVRSSLVNVTC